MSISNYLENKLLDKVLKDTAFTAAPVHIGLHTADPGETGANEVAGGSYARQQVAAAGWNAASGGLADNVNAIAFANMPACTVVGISLWDAVSGGNCLWTGWLATVTRLFTVQAGDLASDTITAPGHGFVNGDRVAVDTEIAGALPPGLPAGTVYYVVNAATDTFKLSLTDGGAAVDITAVGSGFATKVTAKVINAGDTFQINAGDLDVKAF